MAADYTLGEYLNALATLESVTTHIASQFDASMPRAEAKNHFDAHALILLHRVMTHNEAAEKFPGMHSLPITQEEIKAAISMKESEDA